LAGGIAQHDIEIVMTDQCVVEWPARCSLPFIRSMSCSTKCRSTALPISRPSASSTAVETVVNSRVRRHVIDVLRVLGARR
jgi:hypothetical protein